MASYTYRLPWPPSVNNYIRRNAKCSYMTKQGKVFREAVADTICGPCFVAAMLTPITGRLAVQLELTLPDRRRRDIDNHIKAVLDALQHAGCFVDDEQIDHLVVKRLGVESPGACDVTITELTQGAA